MLDLFEVKETDYERLGGVLIIVCGCLFKFKIANLCEVMDFHR